MEPKEMQDYNSPQMVGVDDHTMLRDVYRLLLDNSHTTAELLEDLGRTAFSSAWKEQDSASKRVKISEEVTIFPDYPVEQLDLPPAVTLLYYAAIADAPVKSVTNLLYLFDLLGELAPSPARGNLLYEEGLQQRKNSAKWREEQKRQLEEKELKECTFKPTISDSAKEIAPKGLTTFMERCLEWKHTAALRLQKKAAQDSINRGEDEWMIQWKMGERSRQLLDEFKKKGKRWPKLWEPKSPNRAIAAPSSFSSIAAAAGAHSAPGATQAVLTDASEQHESDILEKPFFHPVTCASVGEKIALLQHMGEDERADSAGMSEKSDQSRRSLLKSYLQRVESDKMRREEKLEKLRIYYAKLANEQKYEKKTGQPLFEPNALPTVVKDGVRVSFNELDGEEQRLLIKKLRQQHQEYVLARYFRDERERREGKDQRRRAPDEVVADLLDQEKKRQSHAEDESTPEETFHPKISARTRRIVSKKQWTPVYERPLPKRTSQSSESPSPYSPNTKSLDACFQRVLARSMEWVQRRNQRVQNARQALEEKSLAECRFQPKVDGSLDVSSIGGGSVHSRIVDNDALVANAEARICTELGLLRSQAALRDAAFIGGVRERLSAVALASAPRPSRSSVDRYARSLSALGSPEYSWGNLSRRFGAGRGTATTSVGESSDFYESHDDDDGFSGDADDVQEIADSWALLDAQTDSILKNCRYY
ncbi:hypothetical protein MOQ_003398 [Trypanosoma cruzi marinkellei]|uniref:Uncharacterized protein n=1 Tax=Trypanosoma cruzi marinkellei TaxID=85056 RepID=K2NCZ1_TRYCR|nr:hypothetical protein MOQ_003398 [Trypanosoma cruzi marinkellei]